MQLPGNECAQILEDPSWLWGRLGCPGGPPFLEPTLTSLQLKQAEGQATLSREPVPTTPASTSMNEHSSGRLGGQSGGVEVESTANSTRLRLA